MGRSKGKSEDCKDREGWFNRLGGFVRLYAAIIQTDVGAASQHAHGVEQGWAWLVRLLKMDPQSGITAHVLEAFLRVAGFKLQQVYKNQFTKLIDLMRTDFMAELQVVTMMDVPLDKRVLDSLRSFLDRVGTSGFEADSHRIL